MQHNVRFISLFTCLVLQTTNSYVFNSNSIIARKPYIIHHNGIQSQRNAGSGHGPPRYDKIDGVITEAEVVGKGSVMLHIDAKDTNYSLDYKPGHVLALEIQAPTDTDEVTSLSNFSEKTRKDAEQNNGWLRGPYTVSRATPTSLDVLIKVVGEKSQLMASSTPGTPVKFGGQFHVPILEGIDKHNTDCVIFVSTGVGIGPCVGAIESAMAMDAPRMELYASFRTAEEVIYGDYLNQLANDNPERFAWKSILSGETGRISSSIENLSSVFNHVSDLEKTHFHLIGNGQMVNEWKEGLSRAGVHEDKVTVETYFNHREPIDEKSVEVISTVMAKKLKVTAA